MVFILFHHLLKKDYVRLNDTLYHIMYNSHPECEKINMVGIKQKTQII